MKKVTIVNFTPNEAEYLRSEFDCLLRHYRQTHLSNSHNARIAYTCPLWGDKSYSTWEFDNPNMATALNKVYYAVTGSNYFNIPCELIDKKTLPLRINEKVYFVFSEREVKLLIRILDRLLNEFSTHTYMGRNYTNPHMANAFNKLYRALTGRDHSHAQPDHYNRVVRDLISSLTTLNEDTSEFEKMIK